MKKTYILLALLLAAFEMLTFLANDMYLPALPEIQSALQLSLTQTQLTLTWWFIGGSTLQLFLGPIADKWGRRPILLIGCMTFIVTTAACAYTQNYVVFLVCRFLQGCTVSTAIVGGYTTIHELLTTQQAIKTIALMEALSILGPAIGPLMGAVILMMVSWPGIFIVMSAGGFLLMLAMIFYVPETLKISHATSIKEIVGNYLKIYLEPAFVFPAVMSGLSFGGFIAWLSASPMLLIKHFHLTTIYFGLSQALVFGSYLIGTRLVYFFSRHLSIARLILVGTLIRFLGGCSCLMLFIFPSQLFYLMMGIMLYALGAALASGSFNRAAIESTPHPSGIKMALFSFSGSLFCILGSWIINVVSVQLVLGVCGLLPLILYYFWMNNKFGRLQLL